MSHSLVRRIIDFARSGGWFFASGLVAGVLNYGFQVVASRELSRAEFASLNGWFANLAVFAFIGGILQYGAVFFPSSGRALKIQLLFINAVSLTCLWLWFTVGGETLGLSRAIMIVVASSLYGWVMGQLQFRLAFSLLASIALSQAVLRLAIIVVPWAGENKLEAYALSFLFSYLPSQVIASLWLMRAETPPKTPDRVGGWRVWTAPVLLSTAVAILPQFDLVVMGRTQTSSLFEEFARASLFYKGVYFAVFIVAQWLLPQQIRKETEFRSRGLVLAVAFAAVSSIAITIVAPYVGQYLLKWNEAPSSWLILGSCIHMSLLTLMYLGIQQACADGRVWGAALALILLVVKGLLQVGVGFDAPTYLVYAIVLQIPIMFVLWRRTTNA